MMLNKISLTIIFFWMCNLCIAQSAFKNLNKIKPIPYKKINHYIGIQVNPLLKQIINLNNNNAAILNPYQLTYAIHLAKSGWGIQTGVGYNYQVISDKLSPANQQSQINDLFYRGGIGKKILLSKKFEVEFGLDYAGEYKYDKTTTLTVIGFGGGQSDSTTSVNNSKTSSLGGGLRGGLNFFISNKICIGTEANYYFLFSNQKQSTIITDVLTQQGTQIITTSNLNQHLKNSKFSLLLPAVLFLTIKF